jgi:hypothetical protein
MRRDLICLLPHMDSIFGKKWIFINKNNIEYLYLKKNYLFQLQKDKKTIKSDWIFIGDSQSTNGNSIFNDRLISVVFLKIK